MQQQYLILILYATWKQCFYLIKRQIERLWQMAGLELSSAADVNDHGSALQKLQRVGGRDLTCSFERICQGDERKND